MKKNILRKDFIIEIKKTMGRFVSIFFIVALGVAFYSGIRASEPSMRITADQYFDDSELMDLKVMGTMGLTKADIKAIGKVSGIEAVEGGYSKDVLCPVGDNEKVVHMLSMEKNFNQVSVVEGRLPEKAGECLVDEDFLSYTDLKVGDTVTFHSGDGEALTDSLVTDTYKIVGIGNSPLYISFGRGSSTIGTGEISGFVVVDKSSFDMDAYTEAYVKVSGAEEKIAFTDEYNNLSDAAKEAVSAIEEVGFRYYAVQKANQLGLTGWVKNLYDGSVEMEVEGQEELIDQLIIFLQNRTYIWIERIDAKTIPLQQDNSFSEIY